MGSSLLRLIVVGSTLAASSWAAADTIDWTQWSPSFTTGQTTGAASGLTTTLGIGVSYSGEVMSVVQNYPSWTPSGTYVGGNVGNAPPISGGIVQIQGGPGTFLDTITFSSPVTNPVMAIWSLGQGGITAQFDFNPSEPFTVQAGGPSAEFAGSSIYSVGNILYGQEGNGTIQFHGTFSSLSWVNPINENWYGFTVGVDAVPEPSTYVLMGIGAGLLLWVSRRAGGRGSALG